MTFEEVVTFYEMALRGNAAQHFICMLIILQSDSTIKALNSVGMYHRYNLHNGHIDSCFQARKQTSVECDVLLESNNNDHRAKLNNKHFR